MSRILLVEDNPAHAEIIQRMLALYAPELSVTAIGDGQEALDWLLHSGRYAAESPPRPDLVLLDIRLPRIDGHAVLRKIRTNPATSSIPVIMLSTSSTQEDVVSALDREVMDYLVKPFTEAHVHAVLRALSTPGTGP